MSAQENAERVVEGIGFDQRAIQIDADGNRRDEWLRRRSGHIAFLARQRGFHWFLLLTGGRRIGNLVQYSFWIEANKQNK